MVLGIVCDALSRWKEHLRKGWVCLLWNSVFTWKAAKSRSEVRHSPQGQAHTKSPRARTFLWISGLLC